MDFYAFSYYYDLAASVGLIGEGSSQGPSQGCDSRVVEIEAGTLRSEDQAPFPQTH